MTFELQFHPGYILGTYNDLGYILVVSNLTTRNRLDIQRYTDRYLLYFDSVSIFGIFILCRVIVVNTL